MTATIQFSFERHDGPRESWPLRSRLLENGQPTPARIPGHCLRHQFAVPDGFLFIADYDCPFEESQHFALVSRDYRVLATRTLGWMYCSFVIERLHWLDDRHLLITIYPHELWQLTIRRWGARIFSRASR